MSLCMNQATAERLISNAIGASAGDPMPWIHHSAYRAAGLLALQFGHSSTNIFAPEGTPARSIFGLSMLVLAICAAIFLIVSGLLLYTLIRYRHRSTDSEREPAQIYGSNQVELSWTVIPVLIVVVLFLATARVIFTTQQARKPALHWMWWSIGHQFWWEYRYPRLGIVTANELHVPVSDPSHPTPTYLTMSSADTDHSFWVPQLAGKIDLIPNKVNTMWIDPESRGSTWASAPSTAEPSTPRCCCGSTSTRRQLCGLGCRAAASGSTSAAASAGSAVFQRNACVNCHTVSGTAGDGTFGPDLSHVASRATIASGSVPNTPENLRALVDDPATLQAGRPDAGHAPRDHDLNAVTRVSLDASLTARRRGTYGHSNSGAPPFQPTGIAATQPCARCAV